VSFLSRGKLTSFLFSIKEYEDRDLLVNIKFCSEK
jgi:hypothetical protein